MEGKERYEEGRGEGGRGDVKIGEEGKGGRRDVDGGEGRGAREEAERVKIR